ncbi:hypothetical protein EYC80_000792 [Monilinia laxa]|uniref:Uncharacterized protein n=1 Tax=Monilinia laxa TaxID=61186 RepID=A0A5N6K7B2_MONLA|nr:hypothetical protein EYC80_000792 [Monilinia laxa]
MKQKANKQRNKVFRRLEQFNQGLIEENHQNTIPSLNMQIPIPEYSPLRPTPTQIFICFIILCNPSSIPRNVSSSNPVGALISPGCIKKQLLTLVQALRQFPSSLAIISENSLR